MRFKFQSRRFWLACWAAGLCTYIVVRGATDWISVATVLIGIVGAWIGSETFTKTRAKKED